MEGGKNKLTMVLFSGDMDKAFGAFTLANSAAAMGWDVTMYFTFWGLNVLKKNNVRRRGRGLLRKMFSVINPGGSEHLPLSKFDFLGMGRWAMKTLMKEFKMPTTQDHLDMAKKLGVKIIACTITMGVLDIKKEDLIPDIQSYAGAVTFLEEARGSDVSFFI